MMLTRYGTSRPSPTWLPSPETAAPRNRTRWQSGTPSLIWSICAGTQLTHADVGRVGHSQRASWTPSGIRAALPGWPTPTGNAAASPAAAPASRACRRPMITCGFCGRYIEMMGKGGGPGSRSAGKDAEPPRPRRCRRPAPRRPGQAVPRRGLPPVRLPRGRSAIDPVPRCPDPANHRDPVTTFHLTDGEHEPVRQAAR
jgi:hypothetical protein